MSQHFIKCGSLGWIHHEHSIKEISSILVHRGRNYEITSLDPLIRLFQIISLKWWFPRQKYIHDDTCTPDIHLK